MQNTSFRLRLLNIQLYVLDLCIVVELLLRSWFRR
jgi:hypothetical protein